MEGREGSESRMQKWADRIQNERLRREHHERRERAHCAVIDDKDQFM